METNICPRWDKLACGEDLPVDMDLDLYESVCSTCGAATGGASTDAVLHTLSGRVHVRTHKWVCIALYDKGDACGATVKFDGIEKGLFAFSEKTVYTRTMLDVILFTIICTKSSISAASAVSAYQLHCSGAITDGDSAQTRQELSNATDAYSRTLLVSRNIYKCEDCYHSPEMPYSAVVADGQTIGIFRDSSFTFEQDTANVPTIPISIENACTVPMLKVRKCVRQRLKAGMGEAVPLNKAEQVAVANFVATSVVAPSMGDHGDAIHRAFTGLWAASCLLNVFFTMSSMPADAAHEESSSSAGAEADYPTSPGGIKLPITCGCGGDSPPTSAGDRTEGAPLLGGGVGEDERIDELSAAGRGEATPHFAKFQYCNIIPAAIMASDWRSQPCSRSQAGAVEHRG